MTGQYFGTQLARSVPFVEGGVERIVTRRTMEGPAADLKYAPPWRKGSKLITSLESTNSVNVHDSYGLVLVVLTR